MSALAEVQRAFTRVCFDETPREEDLALLHDDRERWLMYRRMVRSRLMSMARSGLPRTLELLGKPRFDAEVSRYLAEHGPRTRYIREVVHELVAFALARWESDEALPAHLSDLVRWEDAKWRVASVPWEDSPARELDFEGELVINPTVHVVTVRHRVDKDPKSPARLDEPYHAIVYRKPKSSRVYTYVLNDMGGRLFAAWRRPPGEWGSTCADAVRAVLADLGRAPDERFVDGMAGVLADLVENEVILGSR